MIVNGFVNVGITSMEKRFDINSRDSGLVASFYDIGYTLCSLPVGYFGGRGSKPRWLGFGAIILALGSFLLALPHFTTDLYQWVEIRRTFWILLLSWILVLRDFVCRFQIQGADDFCDVTSNSSFTCNPNDSIDSSLRNYKYVLWLGQFLNGVGASPLYTLGN